MKKMIASVLALAMLLAIAGCSIVQPTVFTINGTTADLAEYNYYLSMLSMQVKASVSEDQLDMYWDTEKDGKTTFEIMKDKALNEMLNLRIASEKAKELGIPLESVNSQYVSLYKQQMLGGYTEAEFCKELNTSSEAFDLIIRLMLQRSMLIEKLMADGEADFNIEEAALKKTFENNYWKAQHILIQTVDSSNMPLPDDQIAAAEAKANDLLARAKSGEDFTALMNEFSEDPGSKSQPEGYIFTSGEMVMEFEEATKNLEINGISDLVKTSYGYHIIKRLPLSADAETETYSQLSENLFNIALENALNKKLEEWKPAMTIEINQGTLDKITKDRI